jgi:trimethylamine--corrinoid protein Co-methyltransferase
MRNVITGDGHFIGEQQTLDAMERDYFYPQLSDRTEPSVWREQGAKSLHEVAREKAVELLAQAPTSCVDTSALEKIHQRYPIAQHLLSL